MSIRINNITKIYGQQKALDNVSFEIKTGEIVGFLGPNGAGKSTLMKIITGYLPQSSGEVFVNEMNVEKQSLEVRRIIGYLPENNPLYLEMYVKEYLSFVAGLYGTPNKKQRIDQMIELTGLKIEMRKKIGALSKGYRQRVGLASTLLHDPKVLILDEPTTGLDPNQIIEIRNLILELGKQKTVMLSTHIMQEVEAICDRTIIINQGKLVADNNTGTIGDLSTDSLEYISVEFAEEVQKEELLKIEHVESVELLKEREWLLTTKSDIRQKIFAFAVQKNLTVLSLQKREKTLEKIFHELTKK